jgi:CSLREA domain-containing protein
VSDANPGNGVCETAAGNTVCTLRAAIEEANALAGDDTIILPPDYYRLTQVNGLNINITGDLTITGGGASTTIIDGRKLSIGSGTVSISGVTIRRNGQLSYRPCGSCDAEDHSIPRHLPAENDQRLSERLASRPNPALVLAQNQLSRLCLNDKFHSLRFSQSKTYLWKISKFECGTMEMVFLDSFQLRRGIVNRFALWNLRRSAITRAAR